MTIDQTQRGTRTKKEDHILNLVKAAGKMKVTDLYGQYSHKYQGTAIRTFLGEYLPALEYRGEIKLVVDGFGYWVYERTVYEKEIAGGGTL